MAERRPLVLVAGVTQELPTGDTVASCQPSDSGLAAIAGLAKTDGNIIVGNGSTWVAESGATARTSLGLGTAATAATTDFATATQGGKADTALQPAAIGTTVQGYDADLAAVAGLSTTGLIERTGAGTAGIVTVTTAGKALLDDADAATQRTTLGVGTSDSPQFTAINLGHASDTTLARSAAGKVTIEGVEIATASNTLSLSGKTLTDPVITGAITEGVYTITDRAAFEIDPGNGSIQLITLGASRTPKGTNFAAGESVTLMVLDGTARTLTWTDTTFGTTGVRWIGSSAPTLDTTRYTVIEFWKVGTQVYGALVGMA